LATVILSEVAEAAESKDLHFVPVPHPFRSLIAERVGEHKPSHSSSIL
jgi:hypothetical protein